MTRSPYSGLSERNFWKTGIPAQSQQAIPELWYPKFAIDADAAVATAGSCFAQHIARHLRARNYTVLDVEPSPQGLSDLNARKFGYSIYSARYGNIYTVRHLLQLTREAFGKFTPADAIWARDGRFFDALRPSVEPNGLPSADAVRRHRAQHLKRVRQLFNNTDVFVFTLGLTEGWMDRESETVYPTAPGTIAGSYDPQTHVFRNFNFLDIRDDFLKFRELAMRRNPSVKFLLTVSPVPLTATATDRHVLVATTYSKSVLRAVAGQLAAECDNVDYFPSYEIIASPASRGQFYEEGLRQVSDAGVEAVMLAFFSGQARVVRQDEETAAQHRAQRRAARDKRRRQREGARPVKAVSGPSSADVVCEDVLLDEFSR